MLYIEELLQDKGLVQCLTYFLKRTRNSTKMEAPKLGILIRSFPRTDTDAQISFAEVEITLKLEM